MAANQPNTLPSPAQPADELASRFIEYITVEKGLAERTIYVYRKDLAQFGEFLGSRALREAQKADVSAFMGQLLASGMEPSSVARKGVTLRQFYRFLLLDSVISKDPTAAVPLPKGWKKVPRYLSTEEVNQLLDRGRSIPYSDHIGLATYLQRRDQALLELFYSSALRASEAATAKMTDLNLSARLLTVRGKGDKTRIVPINLETAKTIEDYLRFLRWRLVKRDSPWLFVGNSGKPLTRQQVWNIVDRRARAVGIKVWPHLIRHSCSTHMMENGADIRVIQELLGHADISTTQRYTHVSQAHARKVYLAHHPRAKAHSYQHEQLSMFTAPQPISARAGVIICAQCLRPVCKESKWYCKEHLRLNRESIERLRTARKAAGTCTSCKKPLSARSTVFCEEHRLLNLAAQRRYQGRKKHEAMEQTSCLRGPASERGAVYALPEKARPA